ncbi:MAG: DedA family protein [Candidatus Dadabacteria bacterium]|nr:MAG: DedA family protein [Candidatus Dadabacteria bacterium]
MNEWLMLQQGTVIYVALFALLMGGAVGLPVPEDIPLIIGGVLAHRGSARTEIVFLVCYFGIVLGDLVVYSLGRYFGPTLLKKPWFEKRLTPSRLRRVKFNIERRSLLMIFIARHLFYMRSATFLMCGAVKMKVQRFVLADATAALISVPLMLGIGYFASEQLDVVFRWINQAKEVSLLVGLALVIMICLVYFTRKKKRPTTQSASSQQLD